MAATLRLIMDLCYNGTVEWNVHHLFYVRDKKHVPEEIYLKLWFLAKDFSDIPHSLFLCEPNNFYMLINLRLAETF